MSSSKFPVILMVQGQAPKTVQVSSGATVRSALTAAKLDAESLGGSVTINRNNRGPETAELSDRLQKDDYLSVTPKVAGGSR